MIRSAKALFILVSLGLAAFAQTSAETPKTSEDKASAYYNFAMGRVYSELAQATGNKPGTLVVSELAKVEGDIDVAHVVINGTIAGPVRATEYVELLPKARVTGNVSYKTIEIHVGAIVMGQLMYENPSKSDKVVELKPASGSSD